MAKLYYEVKSELRFIATISIFVVTFMNIFFNYVRASESNRTTFHTAPLVGIYLVAYFMMHCHKRYLIHANSDLRGVHAWLLLNIAVVCLWVALVTNVEIIDQIGIPVMSKTALVLNFIFFMLIIYIFPGGLVFAFSFPRILIKELRQ